MSAVFSSEQLSDNTASCPESGCSSGRVSAGVAKDLVVAECDRDPGLFAALCEKLFCRRGCNDDDDTSEAHSRHGGGFCSLCCGGLSLHRREQHRTVLSSSKQMSVHWLPSPGSMEATTTRQPGAASRHRQPKCSCIGDFASTDSCAAAADVSRACVQSDPQSGGTSTLRRCDCRVSDSLPRGKQSAAVRRVMLADAAYGHAMVLDDCMMSDSDAWSGSLSLSRPNSGNNSLERGASASQENANEVYESYSDDDEGEEAVVWPAVMPLPALPVYDQVQFYQFLQVFCCYSVIHSLL